MTWSLAVAEIAHGAAGFVSQWDFAHEIACRARKTKLNCRAFPLFCQVSVD